MSNPFKVVVTDFVEEPATLERETLGEIAEVNTLQAVGEESLVGKVEDADAIMLYHYVTITRQTIERLTNCRLIVRCGVGYDNIDHVFAREPWLTGRSVTSSTPLVPSPFSLFSPSQLTEERPLLPPWPLSAVPS